jgi:hypothetical protein
MSALVGWLLRQAWRRGVLGGSRLWIVLGAAALLGRYGRRALKRSEDVVYSERLFPGQKLVISHEPPPR